LTSVILYKYINTVCSLILQFKGKGKAGHVLRAPIISRQSTYDCDKVVSPTHWSLVPPPYIPGTFSVRGWVECGSKDQANQKTRMIPSGIKPAPFRVVKVTVGDAYSYRCDTVLSRTVDLLKWKFKRETKMSGSETIIILVSVKYIVKSKEIQRLN